MFLFLGRLGLDERSEVWGGPEKDQFFKFCLGSVDSSEPQGKDPSPNTYFLRFDSPEEANLPRRWIWVWLSK